jgi:phage shock protein A
MGLLDRIGMVARSNLNALVTAAEDPEKILEQSIIDMQEDLVQLRQAVAQSMASFKRQEQQYTQAQTQADEWERRAMLALQKGDEGLAREALNRKKTQAETAASLKGGLDQQSVMVEKLKKNLISIESKISEAKTKKEMLKARLQSAKAQENLNNMLGKVNTNAASAVFDRMEERVLMQEAKAQTTAELVGDNLEDKFALLESGNGVDDELEAMKARLLGGSSTSSTAALPPSDAVRPSVGNVIDAELEEMRRQMGR